MRHAGRMRTQTVCCTTYPVVDQLPLELQRSFDLMKELDKNTEGA